MSTTRSRAGAVVASLAVAASLVLVLLPSVRAEAAFNATMEDLAAEHALDAAVEAALAKVLAALSHPESLQQYMADKTEDAANETDCQRDLKTWQRGLAEKETWAFQLIDASSKLISGVLYGNLADLGNFDECVATQASNGSFTGRYALLALELQAPVQPSEEQARSQLFRTVARLKHQSTDASAKAARLRLKVGNGTETEYKTALTLRMAVCVPSGCKAPVVEAAFGNVLTAVNWGLTKMGLRLAGRLPEEYTTVAGPWRQADAGDWSVIALCIVLLVLVFVGTAADILVGEKANKPLRQKLAIPLAFSAWTNGRRLIHVAPPSDTNFTCINGIRFISAMWVILGHRYRYALDVPFTNLITIRKRISDISVMCIASAPLSVDTFFVIGGLVNCYAFMKATHGRRNFNFVMYYVHRYIRLTPAFALMIGITGTWLSLLGTGPLWYQVAGGANRGCRANWWQSLLYVSNYADPENMCMMQAWYLMVDMQLHWLSPLILVPLWKWRRAGLAWMGVVIAASCAVPFALSYVHHFKSPVETSVDVERQKFFMEQMYYVTHPRFTSYVCGTLAGFLLYLIKTGQVTRRLTSKQVALGWTVCTAVCLAVVFGARPLFDDNHPYDKWESAFYIGLYRLGWAFGIIWIVMACILGHGGPVNGMLSWGPFTVLGRLTYGIYLTHAAVQIVDVGSMRTSDYYSDFKMVERMFSDTAIATVLGACLCLTMESPITAIEKMLRGGGRRPRPQPAANGVTQEGVANSAFVADEGKVPLPETKAADESATEAVA